MMQETKFKTRVKTESGTKFATTDLKRSAQKDLEETQTQFPWSSFSSLPSVGSTEGNEEDGEGFELTVRGISIPQLF
jgi:hypothetical protein